MVDIVTFDPNEHFPRWERFMISTYSNPNYVLLSPAFLRWQFLHNPANDTDAFTLWLVLHKGEVVAQLGVVPFRGLSRDGSRFSGAYPINLMTRPEYRAVGLGAILLNKLLKQVSCVLNPGVNEAGAALGLGLGMHDLGTLRRYVAIIDGGRAQDLAADRRLPSKAAEARPPRTETRAVLADRIPPGVPEAFSCPVPVHGAERSIDVLRWRYENHPGFPYEFLLSGDLRSILIFHEERESGTGALVLRVIDFLAAAEDQDALLASLVETARARGAAVVDFFCSLACYDKALKRAGFFDEADHADGRIAALFQPLDFRKTGIRVIVSGPDAHQTGRDDWYVTKADSDQDRPNDKVLIREA